MSGQIPFGEEPEARTDGSQLAQDVEAFETPEGVATDAAPEDSHGEAGFDACRQTGDPKSTDKVSLSAVPFPGEQDSTDTKSPSAVPLPGELSSAHEEPTVDEHREEHSLKDARDQSCLGGHVVSAEVTAGPVPPLTRAPAAYTTGPASIEARPREHLIQAALQAQHQELVPVRFEERLPSSQALPQSGREVVGGDVGRGGFSSLENLVRLPDGRFQDTATGRFFTCREWDGQDELSNPRGMCYDAVDDALYVADTANGRIQRFCPPTSRVGMTVAGGKTNRELDTPLAVAVAADGSLFVADSGTGRVLRYPALAD